VIFQQFLAAVSPVSFYIRTLIIQCGFQIQASSHKNEATGEQLIVRQHPINHDFLIGRFSSADVVDGDQWMREMGERTRKHQLGYNLFGPRIKLFKPSLGSIDFF
jgi:hypothetical protein